MSDWRNEGAEVVTSAWWDGSARYGTGEKAETHVLSVVGFEWVLPTLPLLLSSSSDPISQ
ncbi:hypothetical protein QCA50_016780 [Cerrena zonata]|uniref:Uncharacterized protein n=1 Tax=Cerrena zonata TaxID=2478898 RepID=A0AAW0FMI8_9APHY